MGSGEDIYKTGDLVRYNDRGELLYLGRRDFRLSIWDNRIELGEVEAAAGAASESRAVSVFTNEVRDRIVHVL